MLLTAALLLTASATATAYDPDHEPAVIGTYNVNVWTDVDDTVVSDQGGALLPRGSSVVVWPIACEPSTEATTFDNASTLKCTPARLNLPATAPSPDLAGGSARDWFKNLDRCFATTTKKAPAVVDAAVAVVGGGAERARHRQGAQPPPLQGRAVAGAGRLAHREEAARRRRRRRLARRGERRARRGAVGQQA